MAKELSKEAQSFVKNVQDIQQRFAKATQITTAILNKNGEAVISISRFSHPCLIIQSVKEGLDRCCNFEKDVITKFTSGELKEPVLIKCHANFTAMFWPIKIGGEVVGAGIGCGGVATEVDRDRVLEILKNFDAPENLNKAIRDLETVPEEKVKDLASRLMKLGDVLVEEKALLEVLSV